MNDLVKRLRSYGGDDIRKESADRIEVLEAALRRIADAPAWGAPERWETTPFEVRQLARDTLALSSRQQGGEELLNKPSSYDPTSQPFDEPFKHVEATYRAPPRKGDCDMTPTESDLKRALSLAVNMLAPLEPPDSRAVSNEFVALASVECGDASPDVMKIIDDALRGVVGTPTEEK